jgi:hypothetical protein
MTRAVFLLSLGSYVWAAQTPMTGEAGDGYKPLLNGRDLGQWIGDQQQWKVERGVLTGTSGGKSASALVLGGREFGDFELRFDLRVMHGAGGVQMRGPGVGPLGVELEVGASISCALTIASCVQWIMNGSPFVIVSSVQPGEWNKYRVVCKGSTFDVFLNERNTIYTISATHIPRRGKLWLVMPTGMPSDIEFRSIWLKE